MYSPFLLPPFTNSMVLMVLSKSKKRLTDQGLLDSRILMQMRHKDRSHTKMLFVCFTELKNPRTSLRSSEILFQVTAVLTAVFRLTTFSA